MTKPQPTGTPPSISAKANTAADPLRALQEGHTPMSGVIQVDEIIGPGVIRVAPLAPR